MIHVIQEEFTNVNSVWNIYIYIFCTLCFSCKNVQNFVKQIKEV